MGSFQDQLDELEQTWYTGDRPSAFRHAAFQITTDFSLSDTQVIELTAIDKAGDLEVDGWYVDEDKQAVLLFQAMGGNTKVQEGKVAKFWESPVELLNRERVRESPNQSVKDLSLLLEEYLQKDYNVELIFAAYGGFARAADAFAASRTSIDRTFSLPDGSPITCRCNLSLVTWEDLNRQWDDYKASPTGQAISVDFQTQQDRIYEITINESRSVHITLPAQEIVRVFQDPSIGYRLFASNPRGPLANARPNKRIAETLEEEYGRQNFHLLNNGLCATCDDFTITNGTLHIEGLQIVNGCQTTVTLAKTPDKNYLDHTLVNIKVAVADANLAERIAIASNSQTALQARDYTAFEKQQRQLQADFNELTPPWYYELKQGYWRAVLTDTEKAKYKTGKKKRHLEVQPLAQAALAFGGHPSEALDRVRFVFQGIRSPEERDWYERAFPKNIRASQLLLPWHMLDYLQHQQKQREPYSTFHLLWLIAGSIRKQYGVSDNQPLSPDTSKKLSNSIGDWVLGFYVLANAAVIEARRSAAAISHMEIDARAFFRASKDSFPSVDPMQDMKRVYDGSIEREKLYDRDPFSRLP